jgi:hypothetical protein
MRTPSARLAPQQISQMLAVSERLVPTLSIGCAGSLYLGPSIIPSII